MVTFTVSANTPDRLRYNTSRRNVTPSARARRALTQTGLSNASTEPLAPSPISPIIYNGMSLAPQVQKISSHKNTGLSRKWSKNSLSKRVFPPSSLNRSREEPHPLARLFVPSVAVIDHLVYHLNLDIARPVQLGHATLTRLHSHLSPCFPLSYSPRSHPNLMSHYRPWDLRDSNSPTQLWGIWT